MLAIATGVTVANIYYIQPLVEEIARSIGIDLTEAGLLVTLLQVGYVVGLLFLAPLGDLVENKKLILVTMAGLVVSLAGAALAPRASVFMVAVVLIGLTATATQMIVPLAAHLAHAERRGHVVGTVMSGLLFGILLARPVATLIAGAFGWRAVFMTSAAVMIGLLLVMLKVLPRRDPEPSFGYGALIASLWHVLISTPVLQRRSAYQALLFAGFILFWTAMPILLSAPPFSLDHVAMSAFLLSGAAGALIAPISGKLADRGWGQAMTAFAIAAVALSFVLIALLGRASLPAIVVAGIILDAGAQANLIAGQRAIYALPGEIRSRLNALYLAGIFLGGSIGSAFSGYAVVHGGMSMVATIGLGFALIAALLFATEFIGPRKREQCAAEA